LHKVNSTSWEQREISPANILLSRDGHGKLVDLDLAETNTDRNHNVRQVSNSCQVTWAILTWMKAARDFVPFEVASKTYGFLPNEVVVPPIFCYNFLHELESVWWIAIWMLFFHYPEPNATGKLTLRPVWAIWELFPDYYHCSDQQSLLDSRTGYICQSGKIERIVADLHADLRPCGNKLDKLRSSLLEAYSNFEVRLAGLCADNHTKSSGEVLDGIYNDFRLTFQAMTKELESKDVPLIHLYKAKYS
jgi:serine/threonine protein kinase